MFTFEPLRTVDTKPMRRKFYPKWNVQLNQ